jgi:hypothetical protein
LKALRKGTATKAVPIKPKKLVAYDKNFLLPGFGGEDG